MYDVIIVGAGPAGYVAALYAKRYGLDVLVVGKELGGLCNEAHTVENYPGIKSITGSDLMDRMKKQIEDIGVDVRQGLVKKIEKNDCFVVIGEKRFKARSIILALGTEKRRLGIENEERFIGKGVSYCATCDAMFFKDKVVGVVGGRDSAAKSALLLAKHANKVYIIYRRDKLNAEYALKKKCEDSDKIEMVYNVVPKKLGGKDNLEYVILDNGDKIAMDGLFIEIGSVPNQQLTRIGDVEIETENGYISVKEDMSTNVEGVFAAGDVTTGSNKFRQIVTGASEGAIAARAVYEYINQ